MAKNWVHAVSGLSGGLEGDMLRKNDSESSEPLADGLGRPACRYSEGAAYNPRLRGNCSVSVSGTEGAD
jgi:hypothetical protein